MKGRAYSGAHARRVREQISQKRDALKNDPEELAKFDQELAEQENKALKFFAALLAMVILLACLVLALR